MTYRVEERDVYEGIDETDLDRVVPFEIDYDEWLNRSSGGRIRL